MAKTKQEERKRTPRQCCPYGVNIEAVDNGWIVRVGCKTFVVSESDRDQFFAEMIAGFKGERTAWRDAAEDAQPGITGGGARDSQACQPMEAGR